MADRLIRIKNGKITADTNGAAIFLGINILPSLLVNGSVISIFMTIVAGAHIGAVNKSAIPPPIAAAVSAYGLGRKTAAIKSSTQIGVDQFYGTGMDCGGRRK